MTKPTKPKRRACNFTQESVGIRDKDGPRKPNNYGPWKSPEPRPRERLLGPDPKSAKRAGGE